MTKCLLKENQKILNPSHGNIYIGQQLLASLSLSPSVSLSWVVWSPSQKTIDKQPPQVFVTTGCEQTRALNIIQKPVRSGAVLLHLIVVTELFHDILWGYNPLCLKSLKWVLLTIGLI